MPSAAYANNGTVPPPTDSIPVVNPDGSLNCGNPVNAATLQCTGGVPILPDCSLPINAVLPACGGAPIPPPTDSMPVVYPDGSLNCANPVNASTIQCSGGTPTTPDCSLPQNLVLPACSGAPVPPPAINQPMYNGDGSLNCANPANATMATCMNLFQASNNGQLDCARPELQNMPICNNTSNVPPPVTFPDGSLNCANPVNASTIQCSGGTPTSQDCSLPQNAALPFCVASQPMYNSDGSLNCAQPANATMALCMNLFKATESGALDCSKPELQNMPICRVNSVTTNAPTQNLNPLPSTPQLPVTTQVPSVAPTAASAVGTSRVPANNSEQTNKSENTPTKSNSEKIFAEDEGEEEEPAGSISVTYSRAQGSYLISINSNLAGERVTVRASKKGAKSLRFNVSIDEDGEGGVKTKRNLSGFTLALYYGNTKLGEVKAR